MNERLKIKVNLNFISHQSTIIKSEQEQEEEKEEEEEFILINLTDWNLLTQSNQSITSILISISTQSHSPFIIHAKLNSTLPFKTSITSSHLIYHHFFYHQQEQSIEIQISPIHQLINLNQLYLQSINLNSYQYAKSNQTEFINLLSNLIIRQSHQIDLLNSYSYQIILTDPVLQGRFDLKTTSLTLLSPSNSNSHFNSHSLSQIDQLDEIEIEPDFLAKTALRFSSSNSSLLLNPIPFHNHNDLLQALVRTNTLAQLGVCKNDWVLLYSTKNQIPIRLIKLLIPFNESNLLPNQILISPILFNSFKPIQFKILPIRSQLNLPPRFPVLKSVTLSRISSPHIGLKQLQPIFLNSISNYFKSNSRILKLNDLIPIPIDSRLSHFISSNSTNTTNDEIENTGLLEIDLDLGPPQTIIYFKVIHLELFPSSILPSSVHSNHLKQSRNDLNSKDIINEEIEEDPEMSELLENAKLGAILDPNLTKLVQTGLEQSYIPNLASSLGIRGLPPLDLLNLNHEPTKKLYEILRSSSQPDANQYELPYTILINGPRGVGKRTMVSQVTSALGYHLADLSTFSIIGETEIKTSALLETWIERVISVGPCVLYLREIEGIARKLQTIESGGKEPTLVRILDDSLKNLSSKRSKFPMILIGSTSEFDSISIGLLNLFKLKLNFASPNEIERKQILKNLTSQDLLSKDVNLNLISKQTSSLVAKDLVTLVSKTRYNGIKRILSKNKNSILGCIKGTGGIQLNQEDFKNSLNEIRKKYSDRIGSPKIPNVKWEDIGGLKEVKSIILETLSLPLNRPELFLNGLKKRSGILLFGPPGTGKTLIAKAVATSIGMNFMSIKGPELLDQYIGESESKVRKVFEKAKECKPSVIFFDELDSLAPRRGNQGDSGGVMDRIVSQLLAELDSISTNTSKEKDQEGNEGSKGEVFVIGATNRPDLLDPALLRPGRFEKLVYLGGIESDENRLEVIKALTRKMKLDKNVKFEKVIEKLRLKCKGQVNGNENGNGEMIVTGADLYSICSNGMMKSMRRITEELKQKKEFKGKEVGVKEVEEEMGNQEILIKQEDLIESIEEWKSSVSENEMKHYKMAQLKFTKEGNLINQNVKDEEDGSGKEEEKEREDGNRNRNGNRNGKFEYEGKGKGKQKENLNGNGKEIENGNCKEIENGNEKEIENGNGKEIENEKGKGKGKGKGKERRL